MSRRPRGRVLYDGCFAHVYSRALERRFIYREDDDFHFFKSLLAATKVQGNYQLYHYCLMNTHFHLVVSINRLKGFSDNLKEIKQRYAMRFQEKYKHRGPVWWGRFGSQLIESEKYLYACGLYVEMNPVKAGITQKPEDWFHGSAPYYFLGRNDQLVDNYERPSFKGAMELTEGLNVGRGSYIGSPLFLLNHGNQS